MKRLIALTIGVAAVVGLTQTTFSGPERYASKEVVPAKPECDWTGWYIGLHFGGGRSSVDWRAHEDLNDLEATQDVPHIFGGLQLGYNRQINDWLVLGWELTLAGGGLEDSRTFIAPDGDRDEASRFRANNDFIGTLGVRLGFTGMNNHALFYVKGGAAITHWNYDYLLNESLSVGRRPEFDRWSEDHVAVSPFFGIGMEYMVNCHWSANLEYNHIFIYDESVQGTLHEDFENPESNFGYRYNIRHDTVRLGINYHF